MANYEASVACTAGLLARPLVLIGWSMGGLAAMMAVRRVGPEALVLLEPSPPGELQGFDPAVKLERGVYDPEPVYGSFPDGVAARPESLLARAERKRGISVTALDAPTLVVSGNDFAEERGAPLAARYGAEHLSVPGAGHWSLVLDWGVREQVARWVAPYVTRSTG
jgi:pimeloyl-ACP methyl ester carboxylesterase